MTTPTERPSILIPRDKAGDMPMRIMEQLKEMVVKRANGQSITPRGFGRSPSFWAIYFELGDDKSTFAEIIRRKPFLQPVPKRDPVDRMNRFEMTKHEKVFGINLPIQNN